MDENAILGGILAFSMTFIILILAMVVLLVVAWWKLYTKAGEKGWKSLIPIYNQYILCKICWKPYMCWVILGCSFGAGIINAVFGIGANTNTSVVAAIIYIVLMIVNLVLYILYNNKLSKAYGHGVGFTLGLMFFPNIFLLILAFGKSEYVGPQ